MTPPRGHAEPRELVAYHAGQMAEEEAERLRDHLALCSECSELLLDLIHFDDLEMPEGVAEPSEVEVAAALESLKERLGEEERKQIEPVELPTPLRFSSKGIGGERAYRPLAWPVVLPWALAASLAAVAIGLGLRPTASPFFTNSQTTRSSASQRDIGSTVSLDEGDVDAASLPFDAVVVIRDSARRERWRSEPFLYEGKNVDLAIPRRAFRPGSYSVQLIELDGEREKPMSREIGFRVLP